MDVRELAKLVGQMRDAQKAYFRDRTQAKLAASKALEAKVDREVRVVLEFTTPALPFEAPPWRDDQT